jgi:hypothetical protein
MKSNVRLNRQIHIPVEIQLLLLLVTHIGLAIYYFVHDRYAYHSTRFDAYLDIQLSLLFVFAAVQFIPLGFFYSMARIKHYWALVALRINVLMIVAVHGLLSIAPGEFESVRWFFIVTCFIGIIASISLFTEKSRFVQSS